MNSIHRNNQKKNFWYLIDKISVLCSISGVTIFELLENIFPEILQYKNIAIMFLTFLVIIRYQRHVIPRYLIEKEDKPDEEARGSLIVTSCIVLFFSVIITLQFVNLHSNISSTSANNTPNNIKNSIKNDNKEQDSEDDNQSNSLTPLEQMIEEYIVKSSYTTIPIEELELLSDEELYYIRNGILAYSGQYFESRYYERFSWYIGNVSKEDVWSRINPCQLKNINNIKRIENQRKNDE